MDTWTFIWLMFAIKIPLIALFLIVRWAIRAVPEPEQGEDGGIGPVPRPVHPHHPRPTLPRLPRRGPHRGPTPSSPSRVRSAAALQRLPR